VPALNTSNRIFVDLVKGVYPGIISLTWGLVDVRDVAEAHVRAMETPAARGRYICAGACASMRQIVDLLKRHGLGAKGKLPSLPLDNPLGNGVVRVASFMQPKGVGSYLRTHVGRVPRYDTTKIQRELGIRFRTVEQSVLDTMADLQRWGHLPA
jgi:dihydroflavonol-4-reductase